MAEIIPLDIAPIDGGALTDYMREKLDPSYVKFYDEALAGNPQVHERPPRTFRAKDGVSYIPGQSKPVPVGRQLDIDIPRKYTKAETKVNVRVFWPQGARPTENGGKLPCFLHIHGGGWVLGSKGSELHQCTNFCVRARCVVVTVDYRLAPEDPFPAAVEDCWEALQWVIEDARAEDGGILGIDDQRISVGGASAGGNLAATLSHMLLSDPYAPRNFQLRILLLVIPAVDFTAGDSASGSKTWDDYPSWKENALAPALPAAKLFWYRNMYLPNLAHRHSWYASPIFAPEENFPKLPRTSITVAELDPLRDEGVVYAKKCQATGVKVDLKLYKGMPHPAISQDALLETGAQWLTDLCDSLKTAFWP